jgi:hypothetical protein
LCGDYPSPCGHKRGADSGRFGTWRAGETVPCGPDPEPHLRSIREAIDAGFDHVYLHQIGPDQEGFFRFFEREIRPKLEGSKTAA